MRSKILFVIIVAIFSISLCLSLPQEKTISTQLEKSTKYVGAAKAVESGYDGEGITIAVIDTGIDYTHPDLFGFGENGKVIGGHNFINPNEPPLDLNGHGTEVAGVIAADGAIKGIAPKAKLLSYKVSENGEGVSSELITSAIRRAVEDKADIINISLGVNKTNYKLDDAVQEAVDNEIVVITASGNDGPQISSIGSPGITIGSITVGASYNNVTSSLVGTLRIDENEYVVVPMVGTEKLEGLIDAEIVYGKYSRQIDLLNHDYTGKIILAERGSDNKDELIYFSIKESNAADVGAVALIVYNNEPGMFLGELVHDFNDKQYKPRIPVVSISQEEGLEIKDMLENKTRGLLDVFYHPDFVAQFSSRGPISPFYIKPNLVAPGVFINTTTLNSSYNFTSGTSFAAPHVTGAAALLLDRNPSLHHHDLKSILITTSDPISDQYGHKFPFNLAGAGRLNVTRALEYNIIIQPPELTYVLSPNNPNQENSLSFDHVKNLDEISIEFEGPDFIKFDKRREGNIVNARLDLLKNEVGQYDSRIWIENNGIRYQIPVKIHVVDTSLLVQENDGLLKFDIIGREWSFAKITVTNSQTGKSQTVSKTNTSDAVLVVDSPGKYWITADIKEGQNFTNSYTVINVESVSDKTKTEYLFALVSSSQHILLVIGTVIVVGVVGIYFKKRP